MRTKDKGGSLRYSPNGHKTVLDRATGPTYPQDQAMLRRVREGEALEQRYKAQGVEPCSRCGRYVVGSPHAENLRTGEICKPEIVPLAYDLTDIREFAKRTGLSDGKVTPQIRKAFLAAHPEYA